MDRTKEDKVISLDIPGIQGERYIIHSAGDDKTSHRGNQEKSVIVISSKGKSSPMASGQTIRFVSVDE